VPRIQAADTTREVDEAVAVHIFDYRAFSALNKHRRNLRNTSRYGVGAPVHPLLGAGAWNRSS
jgi:hypothetical protein